MRRYIVFDNPKATMPSVDGLFIPFVSFELLLLSIEQSLRLILLMNYSVIYPVHNIFSLYDTVSNKSSSDGLRRDIVNRVNTHSGSLCMDSITDRDIRKCFQKHDSSYSSFRYFGLDNKARSTLKWEVKSYEIKLLHCVAVSLIEMNEREMRERGIVIYKSMRKVPKSRMTDELQGLMARMKEESTR